MYDLRAILKRLKFPISTTLAGRSCFHNGQRFDSFEAYLNMIIHIFLSIYLEVSSHVRFL